MTSQKQKASDIQIYSRLLSYVTPFWAAFLISIIGFLIYSLSNVAFVQLLSYIVDSIDGKDPLEGSSVAAYISGILSNGGSLNRTIIPLAMILIAISRGLGSFMGQYFITYVSTNVIHEIRCELFDQLLKLPSSFYDKNALGHLVAKVTYHVAQVTGAATDAIRIVIREGFTVIGYLALLLYLNWRLTLIFFMVAPFIALLVRYAGRRFRKISLRIQNSMGDVTHVASETIQGYRVVRTFGGTDYERDRFRKVSNYNRRQSMKMAATSAINSPIIQFLVAVTLAALVWLVLDPRLLADMTAGKVIAFITTAGLLAKPLRQLSDINSTIQRGLAAAKEIFELFDEQIEDDYGIRKLDHCSGKIEFKDVCFAYDSEGSKILHNINFIAQPGQTVALVGRSGSGKSSLVSLIPRFYSPTGGQILLDDIPITDIGLSNLRDHIAVVTQQVTLFNDTVRRNIAYGDLKNASEEDVREAADKAYALEFIEDLENGLDTIVGDDGVLLSGGQRQRMAIARAFLKDAPVLILDEATSALDSESEKKIQSALEAVVKNRTTLIIAHRLSTIERADVILVMEDGQIVEQGDHLELLERGGIYSQLHFHQATAGNDSEKGHSADTRKNHPIVVRPNESYISWRLGSYNMLQKVWYGNYFWSKIFMPFSYLFQHLARKRRLNLEKSRQSKWRSPVPVVVVGNVNVGGTGKSPLVIWLVHELQKSGWNPGIVSRGYGGTNTRHPVTVVSKTDPVEVGEEAVMIARSTGQPVTVCKDRNDAIQYLLAEYPCDVIISDDGLQHYAMARDIEIIVIDGSRGIGNGLCFPSGPLREPPSRLSEADFVVINGELTARGVPVDTSIRIDLLPVSWVNLHTNEEVKLDAWPLGNHVHAIAGIGNPKRFFSTLSGMGFDVIGHAFEDHRIFQTADILFPDKLPVVMTEKDAVKCRKLDRDLMHQNYWYLKVGVVTETNFIDSVKLKLDEVQARNLKLVPDA